MGDIFSGWRRRLGLLTLLMALLAIGGWVRSIVLIDNPYCPAGRLHAVSLLSLDNHIGMIVTKNDSPGAIPVTCGWQTHEYETVHKWVRRFRGWRWYILGFGSTGIYVKEARWIVGWFVPYWSITVPLTLLSAWLLLSKPRKSKPMKTAEPVPAEGN